MSTVWRADISLATSCSAARHAVAPAQQFIVALSWRKTLLEVLESDSPDPGEPVSVAACLAIAYACHAPYILSAPRIPISLQPFRNTLQRLAYEAECVCQGNQTSTRFAAELDTVLAQRVADALFLLLGEYADVERLGRYSPAEILAGSLSLMDSAAVLIGAAQNRKLALAERRRVHDEAAELEPIAVDAFMRIAEHNETLVPTLVLTQLARTTPLFLEPLGDAYGARPQYRARALIAALLRSEHSASTQAHFLPAYFYRILKHHETPSEATESELESLYDFVVQLSENALIPSPSEGDSLLRPSYVMLRSTALSYCHLAACRNALTYL